MISVESGTDLVLTCIASYPVAQNALDSMARITWTVDPERVDLANQNITIIGEDVVSELHLGNVNSSHCGVYSCSGTDRYTSIPSTENSTVLVNTGTFTCYNSYDR